VRRKRSRSRAIFGDAPAIRRVVALITALAINMRAFASGSDHTRVAGQVTVGHRLTSVADHEAEIGDPPVVIPEP
jgi:hypothetical protein